MFNPKSQSDREPAVLRPFVAAEAIDSPTAAKIARVSTVTIRNWCQWHHIGRRIGDGFYRVSLPALTMFLEGDQAALDAYLAGDRQSDLVLKYFVRTSVPLPQESERLPAKVGGVT
jgi:hypothetical protein